RHQLAIKPKDGSRYGAAKQGPLDDLLGDAALDPLEFERMKPREQAEALRTALGLDFAAEDAKRDRLFETRTTVNREVKRLQGAVDSMPRPPEGAPTEVVSVVELSEELDRRRVANTANDKTRQSLDDLLAKADGKKQERDQLYADLDRANSELNEMIYDGKKLRVTVNGLQDLDAGEVLAQIENAESDNAAVRTADERAALVTELGTVVTETEDLSRQIDTIDKAKADATANAKYPVPGLGVEGDVVMLDGQPFEQASQSGRLRASMAIGLMQKPELNIMRVKDGSRLDPKSMDLVKRMAREAGAQLFIEVVIPTDSSTVIIEDGRVLTPGDKQP
ncbi:hypothetical protein LCGC14_2644570, partial [marine sediment metagenome]